MVWAPCGPRLELVGWRPPRPDRFSDPAVPVTGPTPRPKSWCGSSFLP